MVRRGKGRKESHLTFDPVEHEYRLDGKRLPSVTEIVSRGGHYDGLGFVDKAVLNRKGQVGTAVHEIVQWHIEHDEPFRSGWGEVDRYAEGYRRFIDETGFDSTLTEEPLACERCGFAGTPDLAGWIGAQRVLIDLKTVSSINRDAYELQLAGYQHLLEEETGKERTPFVCQLKPDGRYRLINMESVDAWVEFQRLLRQGGQDE